MDKPEKTGDSVIDEALERFDESQSGTDFNRQHAEEDIRFSRLGDQWPDAIRKQREAEGRPILTINRLPAFIRQVVNEGRQNKPGIVVVPVDGGADIDTADVIGGLIRSIERGSNAEVAYDTALEHAVSCGFGFFRLSVDYAHEDTFEMEARIERVANPLSVHWDCSSTKFDASDWDYGFISDWIRKDAFEKRYPKAQPVSFDGDARDRITDWLNEDSVRVAEYFLRTPYKRKLVLFSDGVARREDDLKKTPGLIEFLAANGVTPTREREADCYKVTRRLITGVEVLEETEWPGSTIPICPVWGDEVIIDGRRHFRSLIRDARDPQIMYNFWRSASTEMVALAPRVPFIAEMGAIPQGPEGEKWRTANTRSHPYLLYNKGQSPPQRQPFPSQPVGAIQEALNASDDMKAIMGIYDAALGARSNETSGVAIRQRQLEGDTSTFHFIDNLARAIQYAGRCLIEIIPSVYSAKETIRILGPDEAPKVVKLTQESAMQQGIDTPSDNPEARLYNLSVGKYDVTVKAGPSYATRREEAANAMIEMIRAQPDLAPIMGDLLVENLDFPNAPEVAKRLKKMLPPQLQEGPNGQPAGLPPEIQAQISQGTELIQKLQAENAAMKQDMSKVQIDAQMKGRELEFRQRESELNAAIQSRELSLKELEIQLKAAEMQAAQANAQAVTGADVEQRNAVTGLAQLVQQALAAAQESNAATQQAFMSALADLKDTMARPRTFVRGSDGRVVGVQ